MATFPSIEASYGVTKRSAPKTRVTFLDDRAEDRASFDYTPPGESTSYKFVCDTWQKQINVPNRATITATFRQVFES